MTEPRGNLLTALVGKFASRLRFPQLFGLAATLFLLDLIIPDFLPFVDEILLGLATLALGMWREQPSDVKKPPMKDVTPPRES